MTLDFSPIMYGDTLYAVHCRTEEQADALLACLMEAFPENTRYWSRDDNKWWNYEEYTCYAPYLNGAGNDNRLVYCSLDYFIKSGYEIVEFEALSIENEILEVTTEDFATLIL